MLQLLCDGASTNIEAQCSLRGCCGLANAQQQDVPDILKLGGRLRTAAVVMVVGVVVVEVVEVVRRGHSHGKLSRSDCRANPQRTLSQ